MPRNAADCTGPETLAFDKDSGQRDTMRVWCYTRRPQRVQLSQRGKRKSLKGTQPWQNVRRHEKALNRGRHTWRQVRHVYARGDGWTNYVSIVPGVFRVIGE
jgi:hypothetical protein